MPVNVETKVGIFFLIGLVILGVVTFKVEDLGALLTRQVTMTARFDHAAGLKVGDTVAVAGMKVGEIKSIQLRDNKVEVVMGIDAKVRIKEDATAKIAWAGLLGNRYVDISLGDTTTPSPDLPPGSEIKAEETVHLGQVFKKINTAATKFETMLEESDLSGKLTTVLDNIAEITKKIVEGTGTIGRLVNDPELYESVKKISEDIKEEKGTVGRLISSPELHDKALAVVEDLKKTSTRIEKLIAANDERIEEILKGFEAAAPEAKDAFAGIKTLTDKIRDGEGILPALLDDKEMLDDLKTSLARLSKSLDRIEAFTNDLKDGKGLAAALASDEELANDVREAVESLKAVASRVEKGDGTLARLTRDSDLYDDVKKMVDDVRETLRRVKEQVPVGTFASVLLGAF